jgi:hypothetical protein
VRIPPELRRGVERALKQEVAERERHRAEATVFLGRRLKQLANERERLLKAYYAEALEVATLKRGQARINAEVAEAEAQLSGETAKLKARPRKSSSSPLSLAERCSDAYLKAGPDVRKLWNQASFQKILVGRADPAKRSTRSPSPHCSDHIGAPVHTGAK